MRKVDDIYKTAKQSKTVGATNLVARNRALASAGDMICRPYTRLIFCIT